MALTRWFIVLLAVGALPIVLIGQFWALPAWLGVVLVITGIDLALAASPRRLGVERTVPARGRLGEPATTSVRLTNLGSRRMRALVRDAWPPSAQAAPSRHRVEIPPGERRSLQTVLTPFRRGRRVAGEVTVRSFGPLRLAARQATLLAPGELTVLPPFRSRKHLPSRLERLRELDGATSIMVRGQGTEFDSLRDYVRGDDVRSIDWRATARRDLPSPVPSPRLVVRTWRPERDRRVVIVIDSGRQAAARIANETRLDTAVESTLLLAALASAAGDRVELAVVDRRVRARVRGTSGGDLLSSMVEAMAPVEPELIEPDWAMVPAIVREATSQSALVVLCTTIDAPGASRALLGMLPQLTRRHRVVVASVTDPDVTAALEHRRRLDDVYLAAAAERALLDRDRVANAIRRLGGDVVLGAPEELPPRLADRYLALKAAGLL
jgi:uncharacterized protein (DUF58 family)